MFERRLKIMLAIIFALALVMLVRSIQLQVVQKSDWADRANDSMRRPESVPAPRGNIYDLNGNPIAFDAACIDAAVHYGAIALDPDWLKAQARARLKARGATEPLPVGVTREKALADEIERVKADVDAMWAIIAQTAGRPLEDVIQTREQVLARVTLLRRKAWYNRFMKGQRSRAAQDEEKTSPWIRWLVDAKQEDPSQQHDAALDAAKITVIEQSQAHVIVADLTNDQQIELGKKLNACPGLVLKQSTHRRYDPLAATVAPHVLGRITAVQPNEIDPTTDNPRAYVAGDEIGRGGLESLGESILRGSKGRIVRIVGKKEPIEQTNAEPGHDVRATLDLALQADVLNCFREVQVTEEHQEVTRHELHGAAIILDVATNEVRVMASYPTYDANQLETEYNKLLLDDVDRPLVNRATMAQFEPGSTVKTVIGSYAATKGVVGVHEGIECTGYLVIPDARTGRPVRIASSNRCWIASMFANDPRIGSVAHHPAPSPHKGRFGNPDGFLILPDALERSCNVYFETVADRLHLGGVHDAMTLFGLGSRTGIGIPEVSGRIPPARPLPAGTKFDSMLDRKECWLAGIGQGPVAATPIQMANVAATFARNGIWMRPKLLADQKPQPGDARDLHLSKEAIDAVHEGMFAVANSDSGTGYDPKLNAMLKPHGIQIAAKTGSAQAGVLTIPIRDAQGHEMREPDANGVPNKGPRLTKVVPPNTLEWYQGTGVNKDHLAHAWFIGYAPADKPKIAFCVFVEYGGSGGHVAGAVARDMLEACIKHGYFADSPGVAAAQDRAKP
jgi:penicillin-binding protein 2